VKAIYDEQRPDFPFKSISEQFAPGETYQKIEYSLTLPFDAAVEQVEISIANNELFSKYLKLFRIETPQSADKGGVMHLRGGFYDQAKK